MEVLLLEAFFSGKIHSRNICFCDRICHLILYEFWDYTYDSSLYRRRLSNLSPDPYCRKCCKTAPDVDHIMCRHTFHSSYFPEYGTSSYIITITTQSCNSQSPSGRLSKTPIYKDNNKKAQYIWRISSMLWHDNDVDVKSSSYVMMLRFFAVPYCITRWFWRAVCIIVF